MTGLRLWHAMALLAVLWAGIYLPGLGGEELKGEEPRRVLPGLEMLRSGDWLQPVVAGTAYHRKPPMINWLTASGVMACGEVSEFAVRLPTVLLVLALGLGLCAAVTRAATPDAGFLAGIFALTNIGLMEKGRLAEIEGAYIAFSGLAFAAWLAFAAPRWAEFSPKSRPWLGWALAGPLLGLAFMTKGPPHLVMFYALAGMVWARCGRWRDALHPAHAMGLLLAAAIGLPWFFRTHASEPSPLDHTAAAHDDADWLGQLSSRLDISTLDGPAWIVQIFQGIANFLPWSVFLIALLSPALRRQFGIDKCSRLVGGLLAGCALAYLIIALTPAARARFTLPLIAPASAALALAMVSADREHAFAGIWRRVLLGLCVATGVLALVLPWLVQTSFRPGAVAASALAIGLVFVVWESTRRWRESASNLALASAVLMVAITALYVGGIQPVKSLTEELRPTAKAINALIQPGEQATLYRAGLQPWVFYSWGNVREVRDRKDIQPKTHQGVAQQVGPLVCEKERWLKEREKIEKTFGPAISEVLIENRWNHKELVFIRFQPQRPKDH